LNVRQRQPRVEDPAHLAYVRTLPCTICGRGPSDPAHIRTGSREYGKRQCGMGEKPDDCWVLPLCRHHHDEQHAANEIEWWSSYGIDPLPLAVELYASRASKPKAERPRKGRKVRPRKPRAERAKVGKSRPLESRPNWPVQSRKLTSRPLRSKLI
jgi:hypothetical protein